MYRRGPRSPWIAADECRSRPIGHIVVDAMASHSVILSPDGGIVSDGRILGLPAYLAVNSAERSCTPLGGRAAKDVLAPFASAMTALRQ
jgi:hypothetical protein